MKKSLLLLAGLALWIWSAAATADDKDLLKATGSAPPNILIVFGNSETTEQPIEGVSSAWDGDADSPASKMGAAKAVLKQWVTQNHTNFNIGMSAFTHGGSLNGVVLAPNKGVVGKSWLYSPRTVDFPGDTFQEPVGTIERWGPNGEGPCTNLTKILPSDPPGACTDRSVNFISLSATLAAPPVGPFFGSGGTGTAYIYVDGTLNKQGNLTYTKRILVTLGTVTRGQLLTCSGSGKYGDAFTDGRLSSLTLGDHSMEVCKVYQESSNGSTWSEPASHQTPNGNPSTVKVPYVPSATLQCSTMSPFTCTSVAGTPDFFYSGLCNTGTNAGKPCTQDSQCPGSTCNATPLDAGKEIGFFNDNPAARDFLVNGDCSGWEFQSNSATLPLIKIPRDYCTTSITSPNLCAPGSACAAAQNSQPCFDRLMRPQARLVSYNQGTGVFTPNDYDNPGYVPGVSEGGAASCPTCYADGCDSNLLGAVDAGLNDIGRQAILQTQNGSQAPIKNLLSNIYSYFTNSKIDGFLNGTRTDDPNAACRRSAVILIYDTFNGCQGDPCDPSFIRNYETPFQTLGGNGGVPVFVIGFGKSAEASARSGVCIAHNTGTARFMPGGSDGYFAVSDANSLFLALSEIASLLNESPQTFSAAAVSATQAKGGQMAYLASFNPTSERSIWNGRLNGYRLDPITGQIQVCQSLPTPCADLLGEFTIKDPNDPHKGATIPFPSSASVLTNPSNPSLIWNAGQNLHDTPGTGATVPSAVLAPEATLSHGTYSDASNDATTTVPTNFYPGRKIVFSLPQGYTSPVKELPIPAGTVVPETRHDMTCPDLTSGKCSNNTGVPWWSDLKALLTPQQEYPTSALSPLLSDADAGDSLRFIWGDRDAVTGTTDAVRQYFGQKLGDIFHSGPLLVGSPNDFAFFTANVQNYQSFFNAYQNRRKVLYVGANDGLLHAFDAGVVGRDSTLPKAYDLGTGAELFAFAPRAIMQIYEPLTKPVGAQTKRDEWTVDLSPSAADVFIGPIDSSGKPAGSRTWHTVLVSGMREGSPFEGTSGTSPQNSLGSYFALDITQPDELVNGVESPGDQNATTSKAPKCLNKSGDGTCARDWPTVLWEITDTTDGDASGSPGVGYPDMGETWSKASMGRVKVCTASCGTSGAVNEDHYVAIFGGGFDRERKNRRGNWLYMVDIETGMTLYKVNSPCGGDPVTSGCTPGTPSAPYFGSIPSGPTAVDFNGDGYLDLIYVGDAKGQLWRVDLTDLRKLSSPQDGRFRNQLDLAAGSGAPFLFFQAGPATMPTSCAPNCFYSMYHRPDAINLGYNVNGRPALGIAFGTGDRDDIRATIDPASITYPQRFYYVVDKANATTTKESKLLDITSPTAGSADTTNPLLANGWMLELINGERVVGDTLTVGGIIRFPTFNPPPLNPPGTIPPCNNANKCGSLSSGVSRLYSVFYNTGNAYPLGSTDRGQTQTNATFITGVTGYIGGAGGASGLYWSGGVQNPGLGVGRKITVRSWKEKISRP